jgi:hypothetical protein
MKEQIQKHISFLKDELVSRAFVYRPVQTQSTKTGLRQQSSAKCDEQNGIKRN